MVKCFVLSHTLPHFGYVYITDWKGKYKEMMYFYRLLLGLSPRVLVYYRWNWRGTIGFHSVCQSICPSSGLSLFQLNFPVFSLPSFAILTLNLVNVLLAFCLKPKSDIHCNRSATSLRPKFKTIAEVAEESQLGFAVGRRLVGDWSATNRGQVADWSATGRRPRGDLFATWCNWSPTGRGPVPD